ncbi:MAG: hypothetical protein K0U66_03625 [Gammaproteobacteria bacterium]|nr:hypothetical protein [Gammaproteobacteria bacterium]
MSVYATDFIDYSYSMYVAAQQAKSPEEISCRTIINRAYYGAFLAARDYAGIAGHHNVHMAVIYYFYNNGLLLISNNLTDLKKLRQIADYNLKFHIKMRHARDCCERSREIIEAINALPPRDIIQARASKWRKSRADSAPKT